MVPKMSLVHVMLVAYAVHLELVTVSIKKVRMYVSQLRVVVTLQNIVQAQAIPARKT